MMLRSASVGEISKCVTELLNSIVSVWSVCGAVSFVCEEIGN